MPPLAPNARACTRLFGVFDTKATLTGLESAAPSTVAFVPFDDGSLTEKKGSSIDLSAHVGQDVADVRPTDELEALAKQVGMQLTRRGNPQATLSVNVPLVALNASASSACTDQGWAVAEGGTFGNRAKAQFRMHSASADVPDDCDDVGIVIVDTGLNAEYVRSLGGRFGGGWQLLTGGAPAQVGRYFDPHRRAADGHGNMIARNVLAGAPSATIYDAPVLPKRVDSVAGYASDATILFKAIAHVIENPDGDVRYPRHKRWIVVNAWAVATGFADVPGPLAYRHSREHRLNAAIIDLAQVKGVDVVFAAGNAGVHAPATHSGPYDRGHNRAIWGANGLQEVFTIAAERTDGMAIGASSQGPGDPRLLGENGTSQKPDFAAPSWFTEDTDASVLNSGSSAACAVFAGWLARLRAVHPTLSSTELKAVVGGGDPTSWSPATGNPVRPAAMV
ncbi:S8/S53 family peptidase [Rhizobiaceae bacterium]|nr:S8/S53 family peptidase [Rhizobiaceae bacterium]